MITWMEAWEKHARSVLGALWEGDVLVGKRAMGIHPHFILLDPDSCVRRLAFFKLDR